MRVDKQAMDLLYVISDGSKADMDAWAGTEIFKFFMGLWTRDDEVHKQIEMRKSIGKKK